MRMRQFAYDNSYMEAWIPSIWNRGRGCWKEHDNWFSLIIPENQKQS